MAIDLFKIGPFVVHGYGLMIGLGFLAAIMVGCYRAKRRGLSDNDFINQAICVLIFGFLGGKLLFLLVNFKDFIQTPMAYVKSEGFVVYGGVITGVISIYIYCRIKKLVFLDYIDLIAPSVAINQAFGRIGCFLAGCCYGRKTDSAIGVIFPEGCIAPAGVKLLPTQLFMAGGDLILFAVLILLAKKKPYPGMVSGMYLLLYSIGRFIIEYFRNDYQRGFVGILSTSQFIAIWISVFAILYLLLTRRSSKRKQQEQPAEAK